MFIALTFAQVSNSDPFRKTNSHSDYRTNWCGTPLQIGVAHLYNLVWHTSTNWCDTPLQIGLAHLYKLVWHTSTNWCGTPLQIGVAHLYKLVWHTSTNRCGMCFLSKIDFPLAPLKTNISNHQTTVKNVAIKEMTPSDLVFSVLARVNADQYLFAFQPTQFI